MTPERYDPPTTPIQSVIFAEEAEAALLRLVPELRFYSNYEDIHKAIEQVLLLDIRSVRRRKVDRQREAKKGKKPVKGNEATVDSGNGDDEGEAEGEEDVEDVEKHRFAIDVLNVGFKVEGGVVHVFKIELDEKLPPKWGPNKKE